VGPQLNRPGDLVTKGMEETEALGTCFTSVFTAEVCLEKSRASDHWECLERGRLTSGRGGRG